PDLARARRGLARCFARGRAPLVPVARGAASGSAATVARRLVRRVGFATAAAAFFADEARGFFAAGASAAVSTAVAVAVRARDRLVRAGARLSPFPAALFPAGAREVRAAAAFRRDGVFRPSFSDIQGHPGLPARCRSFHPEPVRGGGLDLRPEPAMRADPLAGDFALEPPPVAFAGQLEVRRAGEQL